MTESSEILYEPAPVSYEVYVKVDTQQRIIAVESGAFLDDKTNWIKIDEGYGDRYYLAQGNYLPSNITDDSNVYCYKLIDNQIQERTQEEKNADLAERASQGAQTSNLESALEAFVGGVEDA